MTLLPSLLPSEQITITFSDSETVLICAAIVRILQSNLPAEVRDGYLKLVARLDETLNQRLDQAGTEVGNGCN